jgi:acetyl coenzyme A synthetase (ADP forming)-like protein
MKNIESIDKFFNPKSAAVIGASNNENSVGYTIFKNMKNALKDKAYPINPKYTTIQGTKAYSSIKTVPDNIDLAIIAVPKEFVPKTLEECAEMQIKATIIISAGFSETGEKELTEKIRQIINKYPQMRVMGPNCVGVKSTESGIDTTFFENTRMKSPAKGTLSFISQSGALGSMILDWAATQRFGLNKFASYGNAMDVDESDLLEYFGEDKGTKVITMYLEGAKNGRKFFETAKKVAKKKPIIILKGGKHEETSKAAISHTGSLAGSAKVYEAVFHQAGIISAFGIQDLFSTAKILENEPLPKGKKVQIITNGGGFGIVMADHIINRQLELATLSEKTKQKLEQELKINISNPLDLLGDADAKRYDTAIKACIEDDNVDIIVVMILFTLSTLNADELTILKNARENTSKPIIVVAVGGEYTAEQLKKIEEHGFTTYDYPGSAAKSIMHMANYAEYLKKE